MSIIEKINAATNTNELSAAVEAYLASIGQDELARGESYGETAARLGGNDILERAEARWFEIEGGAA